MIVKNSFIEFSCDLSTKKQMLFGLLAAERFIECYKLFSKKEDFGDIVSLLEGIKIIESEVLGNKIASGKLDMQLKIIDKNTPDMDDFGSVGSSLALNVACILLETLSMGKNFDERRLTDISSLCTDSIDFLVLEIEDYDQMDFEKIGAHELMKEETMLQKSIVRYLEKVHAVDQGDIEDLRHFQSERQFNLLNLEKILYAE
jgi:uncharacterized protein YjaG (DUF416 family)